MATECSKTLQTILQERGWSARELAQFLDKPWGTVWNWLHGRTTPPFSTQLEIYQKLGLTDGSLSATEVDFVALLGSILQSVQPIVRRFLVGPTEERARLRQVYPDLLHEFQLYFRAFPSEDAREAILREFPELIEKEE